MRNGKLRHRVLIQQPAQVQDPVSGEVTQGWVDVDTVYASIEPLSAREFIAAQGGQSEISARIVIRHRDDVAATMRILYRGKIYNIQGVLADPKSGLEYLTLPVSEGVNNG